MNHLTPDEAAVQAIQLFSQDATLCERHPNKMARTQERFITEQSSKGADVDGLKGSEMRPNSLRTNEHSLPASGDNSSKNKFRRKENYGLSTYFIFIQTIVLRLAYLFF